MIGGRILDTSALEHVATGRSVYARAMVWAVVEQNDVLLVPTAALTATWSRIPAAAHPVLEVLLGLPNTVLDILDGPTARESGLLLAAASNRGELDAAHVLRCWAQRDWPVLTADGPRLRRLAAEVELEELP